MHSTEMQEIQTIHTDDTRARWIYTAIMVPATGFLLGLGFSIAEKVNDPEASLVNNRGILSALGLTAITGLAIFTSRQFDQTRAHILELQNPTGQQG